MTTIPRYAVTAIWTMIALSGIHTVSAEEYYHGHAPAVIQAIHASNAAIDQNAILFATSGNIFGALRNGKPVGIIAEVADEILRAMGYTIRYISMPSKDMRKAVQAGTVDVAASVLTPTNRFKDVYYTDSVIDEYNVLLVRQGDKQNIKNIQCLHGKRMAGRIGYSYPLLEADPQIILERNRKDGENVRKLLLGEVDAAVVAGIADLYDLQAEGIMAEVDVLEYAVGTVSLGVALANERFSREQLAEFNRRLAEFRTSPQWIDILTRNGMYSLVRRWPILK